MDFGNQRGKIIINRPSPRKEQRATSDPVETKNRMFSLSHPLKQNLNLKSVCAGTQRVKLFNDRPSPRKEQRVTRSKQKTKVCLNTDTS